MGRGSSSGGGSRGSSSGGGGSSRGSSSWGSSRGWSSSRSSSRGASSRSWNSGSTHNTVIIGGHRHYHGGGSSEGGGQSIPIFLGIIFLIFGLVMLGLSINSYVQYNAYATVEARCLHNTYLGGWYYTTYEYTVNGKEYTSMSDVGWEYPETNEYVTIYYKKSNPYFISEENPINTDSTPAIIAGGLLFGGIGLALIITSVKQKKKIKTTIATINDTTPTTTIEETVRRCTYCGSKYDKDSHSCPNCGADN